MADEIAPYLRLPLTFEGGRLASCSMEASIAANIRLILHNQVQGRAKPPGVSANPHFGADLPHHEFRHGRIQDVVQEVRRALRDLEPRIAHPAKVDFVKKRPGRFLPFAVLRVSSTITSNGQPISLDFEIEK